MEQRLDYYKIAPEAMKIMLEFEKYAKQTTIDAKLKELIKIRASQINGCAFCLDMHTKDARQLEETEQRIYSLNAWRETPFYSEKERAALELTEAVTQISLKHVSDDLYQLVRLHFDEKEYVDLIYLINTINSWNRLAISMRAVPGHYQPNHNN